MNTNIERLFDVLKDADLTKEEEMLFECALTKQIFKSCKPIASDIVDWKFSSNGKKKYKDFLNNKFKKEMNNDFFNALYRYYITETCLERDEKQYQKMDIPIKCSVCESTTVSVDHKIPVALGGDNSHENLHYLCKKHNSMKNARIAFVDIFLDA